MSRTVRFSDEVDSVLRLDSLRDNAGGRALADDSDLPRTEESAILAEIEPAPMTWRYIMKIMFLLALWFVGSAVKSVVNKQVFAHFNFPLTVLETQLLLQATFTSLVLIVSRKVFNYNLPDLTDNSEERARKARSSARAEAGDSSSSSEEEVRPRRGGMAKSERNGLNGARAVESDSLRTGAVYAYDLSDSDTEAPTSKARGFSKWLRELGARAWTQIHVILPFTFWHIGAHIFSQFSLSLIPVWMLKVVKGSSPVFAVILSFLFLGDTFNRWIVLSLVPVVCGVVLTGVEPGHERPAEFNLIGTMLGTLCALTYVAEKIAAKKLFNAGLVDPFHLLVHSNVLGALLLAPAWAFFDLLGGQLRVGNSDTYWLLLLNGAVDSVLGIGMLVVLTELSTTSHQIAAAGDRLTVTIASVLYFHNHLNTYQVGGIALSLLGVLLYQRAKYSHDLAEARQLAATLAHSKYRAAARLAASADPLGVDVDVEAPRAGAGYGRR